MTLIEKLLIALTVIDLLILALLVVTSAGLCPLWAKLHKLADAHTPTEPSEPETSEPPKSLAECGVQNIRWEPAVLESPAEPYPIDPPGLRGSATPPSWEDGR